MDASASTYIGAEEHPGCQKCGTALDSAEHTLIFCPKFNRQKEKLRCMCIGQEVTRKAVVGALLDSETKRSAVTKFCDEIMGKKEEGERERERNDAVRSSRWHTKRRRGRRIRANNITA